jgi:hypothetical protein
MGILDRLRPPKPANDNIEGASIFDSLSSEALADVMIKAFSNPTPNQISLDYMPNPNHMQDWDKNQQYRRAIASISNYYNTLGVFRANFDKNLNDKLAENVYFGLVEKAIQDYISTLDFKVTDKRRDHIEEAEWFLKHPNPQDTWNDLIKAMLPDLLRYDAGVFVKTFTAGGYLAELKAFKGTEFWPEIDRDIMHITYPQQIPIPQQVGYLSRGYVQRWWQRSRTGIYVAFQPEEILYFCMYPNSDDVYGTDYITLLRYQIQYLIDSTRAAGMTFANGVVPSIIWNHPQAMDPKQLMARIKEVQSANRGAQNFGSILHTVRDESITTLAHTLHDMEWLEGQRFIGQLVWAMWGFQPSEFTGSNVNRATAYIGRSITKSKVIYPMIKFLEDKINDEILPYLKGYTKYWRFNFIRDIDLEDEMKMAEITAQKANTASILIASGIKVPAAMMIAGMGDSVKTIDFEYYDQAELARIQSNTKPVDGTQKDDHGNPKKMAQSPGAQKESSGSQASRQPQFGDAEERSAGIQKSDNKITLTNRDNIEITFVPAGPSIISNTNEQSKEIAQMIRKDLQDESQNHRERMKNPETFGPVLQKYVQEFNLEVI